MVEALIPTVNSDSRPGSCRHGASSTPCAMMDIRLSVRGSIPNGAEASLTRRSSNPSRKPPPDLNSAECRSSASGLSCRSGPDHSGLLRAQVCLRITPADRHPSPIEVGFLFFFPRLRRSYPCHLGGRQPIRHHRILLPLFVLRVQPRNGSGQRRPERSAGSGTSARVSDAPVGGIPSRWSAAVVSGLMQAVEDLSGAVGIVLEKVADSVRLPPEQFVRYRPRWFPASAPTREPSVPSPRNLSSGPPGRPGAVSGHIQRAVRAPPRPLRPSASPGLQKRTPCVVAPLSPPRRRLRRARSGPARNQSLPMVMPTRSLTFRSLFAPTFPLPARSRGRAKEGAKLQGNLVSRSAATSVRVPPAFTISCLSHPLSLGTYPAMFTRNPMVYLVTRHRLSGTIAVNCRTSMNASYIPRGPPCHSILKDRDIRQSALGDLHGPPTDLEGMESAFFRIFSLTASTLWASWCRNSDLIS